MIFVFLFITNAPLLSLAIGLWDQCGGVGYSGSTQCPPGSTCVKNSDWWSSCKPTNNGDISSSSSPFSIEPRLLTTPASTMTSNSFSSNLKVWDQCGGIGYSGSTQCPFGSTCFKSSDYWSSCKPTNDIGNNSTSSSVQPKQSTIIMTTLTSNLMLSELKFKTKYDEKSSSQYLQLA